MKVALKAAYLGIFFLDLANGRTSLAPSPRRDVSTCPARTVNYITHSLPQLCLSSSRSPHTRTTPADSIGTATGTISSPSTNATLLISHSLKTAVSDSTILQTSEGAGAPLSVSTSTKGATSTVQVPNSSNDVRTDTIATVRDRDDSPLDKANFLSFEEWRRRNLLRMGQPEQIGLDKPLQDGEPRKRVVNVHHALDALGDDNEIDLNFSGFVPTHVPASTLTDHLPVPALETPKSDRAGSRSTMYGKEAGKTSNKRFNYASFDCAANVLKTNAQAKGALAVLGENKDSYMLNECSASNKFIILELCQDIQIDTVVMANFEFFSSTFRTFRVSISDRYPAKADKWQELGVFEARNSRDVQSFLVKNPIIWARYITIEFLSHYGNEYYCPLSLVRIHGRTMLEEYKLDADVTQGDDDEIDEKDEVKQASTSTKSHHRLAGQPLETLTGKVSPNDTTSIQHDTPIRVTIHGETQAFPSSSFIVHPAVPATDICTRRTEESIAHDLFKRYPTCDIHENPSRAPSPEPLLSSIPALSSVAKIASTAVNMSNGSDKSHGPAHYRLKSSSKNGTILSHLIATLREDANTSRLAAHATDQPSKATSITNSTALESPSNNILIHKPTNTNANCTRFLFQICTETATIPGSKLVVLSLQYIEEQSRALSEAFTKVEQRQLAKTSDFLNYLNTTVLNELKDFRQQYDQLWQSTVIELEIQREQFQQESVAINARLGILASEVGLPQALVDTSNWCSSY